MASDLSLAGVRLVIADHAMGLPVLRTLSLCTCCRHYPGAAAGRTLRSASPSRISLPRKGCRVGLRIVLFEACSAFTRVTACTLALSPIRDTLTEGFSHFVSSMTAPVASGWSGCRVGLAPTGKRRLFTAHTRNRHCGLGIRACVARKSRTRPPALRGRRVEPPSFFYSTMRRGESAKERCYRRSRELDAQGLKHAARHADCDERPLSPSPNPPANSPPPSAWRASGHW